jgi:hypothetical protein
MRVCVSPSLSPLLMSCRPVPCAGAGALHCIALHFRSHRTAYKVLVSLAGPHTAAACPFAVCVSRALPPDRTVRHNNRTAEKHICKTQPDAPHRSRPLSSDVLSRVSAFAESIFPPPTVMATVMATAAPVPVLNKQSERFMGKLKTLSDSRFGARTVMPAADIAFANEMCDPKAVFDKYFHPIALLPGMHVRLTQTLPRSLALARSDSPCAQLHSRPRRRRLKTVCLCAGAVLCRACCAVDSAR